MVNALVRCLTEIRVCNIFCILLITLDPKEEYLYHQNGKRFSILKKEVSLLKHIHFLKELKL